jgi:hypothetical protein
VIEETGMNRILIFQPHLINNLQAKFAEEVKKKRIYTTPGTPRFEIVHTDDEDDTIDENCKADTVLE